MRLMQALKKNYRRRGMTFVELVIAIAITSIIILGTGIIVADSQAGWRKMYDKINGEAIRDAYMAKGRFDRIVRQADSGNILIDEDAGQWVEVYYPDQPGGTIDRYANFYINDNALNLEVGVKSPRQQLSNITLCGNVQSCVFEQQNKSIQMILILNDGEQANKMVCSAYLHNR